jgi:hypothetical protein
MGKMPGRMGKKNPRSFMLSRVSFRISPDLAGIFFGAEPE